MSDNLIKSYLYVFLICGLLTVGSNGQTTGPRPSCDETWQETRRRLLSVVSRFRFEIKASYQANVFHAAVANLPSEKGAKTLNLIEHPGKKFFTPFYYGLVDGDHDLKTTNDRLLYLVLFDQTQPIRFAMWNFIKNKAGNPDTHSPAWDWQYVVRNPKVGMSYGYKARVVVKPFKGIEQIWREYQTWNEYLGVKLPPRPVQN